MGKRPAEVESFVGNMGSMQWEDTAFYAKRRTTDHGNGTRTNSSKSCCDQSCISHTGSCKLSLRCKPTSEERSAENPHATFRGSRRRVTASGHPVGVNRRGEVPNVVLRVARDGFTVGPVRTEPRLLIVSAGGTYHRVGSE